MRRHLNKYLVISLSALALTSITQAECLIPIDKSLLTPTEINGIQVYALPKAYVDQLKDDPAMCLSAADATAAADNTAQLIETLEEYQTVSNNLENHIEAYQAQNLELTNTLDQSIGLTQKFDSLVTDYDQLAVNYSDLARQYDELAEKYRNIALNKNPGFSLDGGLSYNDEGFAGLLGIGYRQFKVWGTVAPDDVRGYLGVSVSF